MATERKRIEDGRLGRKTATGDGLKDLDFGLLERERQRKEAQKRKTPATLSLDEGLIQN